MLWSGPDGLAECFHCNRRSPRGSFGVAKVARSVVECGKCGFEVPLTESTLGMVGLGYICSNCQSYVAVEYGKRFVDPIEALKPSWNPALQRRGQHVDKDLQFAVCKTKMDYLVVLLLQVMAKEEDSRFMFVSDSHTAGVLIQTDTGKLLGFLVWNKEDAHAVLRQIFIVPDERRKGLATRLLTFWVEQYADKINNRFGIESPNEKALNLHAKLGHLAIERDLYKGLKCFFVAGL